MSITRSCQPVPPASELVSKVRQSQFSISLREAHYKAPQLDAIDSLSTALTTSPSG